MVELDAHGLLAPGLHPLTIEDVASLFGRFQRSDRRAKLMERLREFAKAIQGADPRIAIILDGSFVMARIDEPGDIDLALILPSDWDFAADLQPFVYNVLSKRMVRRLYGFDLLVGVEGQESERSVLEFFAQVNVKWLRLLSIPVGTRKGLLRIVHDRR